MLGKLKIGCLKYLSRPFRVFRIDITPEATKIGV